MGVRDVSIRLHPWTQIALMESEPHLTRALADRYRIEREIGSGGMSTVYLAEDLKHHRLVAIKVLRPEASAALGTERFLREIEVVAGLNHPNILGLHDSGEADGLLYFVMPYVEGESLRSRLEQQTRLPLDETVRIVREIGDALQYAHDHGLVHRDIKPENILFQAGHAVVCDFGIAQVASEAQDRLTRTGFAVGTFTYMSPEQLSESGAVDRRTDVYALGCLFLEMLSGKMAFQASTPQASLAKKLTGTPTEFLARRPDLPRTLNKVLDRALAIQPEDRFPTAEAFTATLDAALTEAAIERDARTRRRRRAQRVAARVAGVLVLVAVGWWVSHWASGPSMSRIAVLPLMNQSDTSQAFLAQGVHQDLVLELAKAGIGVINPLSVARYAGSLMPVREIASDLGVDGVLQGSTRLERGQVSLELQLVNGRSEEILWVHSFQESLGELVTLYHEVTLAIADQIGLRLSEEAQVRLSRVQETNPQVTAALLQARFHYQKLTEEGFSTALDYYHLVLERDSLSAEAWIGIAQVWGGRAQMGLISGEEANRMAQPALARAQELDPSLSGVQRQLAGRLVWSNWDWSGGEQAFQRALEADPTDSRTRASYAHLLLYLDRDNEALDQAQQAAELDPFNTIVQGFYGMTLNSLRRYREAEATLLAALDRDPEAPILLTTLRTSYHLMGRHEEAMEMWRTSYRSDPEALEALERGYRAEGYSAALRSVADLLVERSDTSYVRPWLVGTLYTRAGMADRAIPYLEQAFEEHDPNMPYIATDPIFDMMRQEPRFRRLVDRLGLPQ